MACSYSSVRPGFLQIKRTSCPFGSLGDPLSVANGRQLCRFHLPLEDKSGWDDQQHSAYNAALRAYIRDTTLHGHRGSCLDLSGIVVPHSLEIAEIAGDTLPSSCFYQAVFGDNVSFSAVTFLGVAVFDNADFRGTTTFEGATFAFATNVNPLDLLEDPTFRHDWFGVKTKRKKADASRLTLVPTAVDATVASFYETTFKKEADFRNTTFSGAAWFGKALFCESACFTNARFNHALRFMCATFNGDLVLSCHLEKAGEPALFLRRTNFRLARFNGRALFNNRRFVGPIDLRDTVFKVAPQFHHCRLYHDINLTNSKFHDFSSNAAVQAYGTLKQHMEELRVRAEETRFFSYEQRSLRKRPETSKTVKLLSAMYEIISNYGQSVLRPLIWFAALQLVFFAVYGLVVGVSDDYAVGPRYFLGILDFVVHQIFNPFKAADHIGAVQTHQGVRIFYSWRLATLAIIHSIANIAVLALWLLALRRQFTMEKSTS